MTDIEKVIWYFKKVCSIPRASGDETAISDYIEAFARERELEVTRDAYHNVIVRKPASVQTQEDPVILQGHVDMVYVKDEDSSHVYKQGIEVLEDESFYFAKDTSLGADNGVAVAYCLALLDSVDIAHPDLEVIFTVQEEVGLVGADVIDISNLKGTTLINLDSEEEGIFYSSCAGGLRCRMMWEMQTETITDERAILHVSFRELAGGHSGMNIGMGRGNAIVLLGRLLYFLKEEDVSISGIDAQGKANTIAKSACVQLFVKPSDVSAIQEKLHIIEKIFQTELQYTDTVSLEVTVADSRKEAVVYTKELQNRIMKSLLLLPYGVAGYSFAVPGLVETSMNMGSLICEEGQLILYISMRSSVETQKYMLRDKIQVIAEVYCDECVFESDYPAWQYKKESRVRNIATTVYEKMFHKKAEIAAIHAGLECGYWDSKKPGLDIISAGPDLFDVHSTREKASKESISNVWMYVKELLKELAQA